MVESDTPQIFATSRSFMPSTNLSMKAIRSSGGRASSTERVCLSASTTSGSGTTALVSGSS